jgi:Beta-lactamase
VVSRAVAGMMRLPHVRLPAGSVMAQGWGLGLLFEEWEGAGGPARVFGHTGHNEHIGSFLRFLPEQRAAVALLFNSAGDASLYHDLFSRLFAELHGVTMPPPWLPVQPGPELDLSRYAGAYQRHGMKLTLRVAGDGLASDVEGSWGPQLYAGRTFRPASSTAFGSGLAARYTTTSPAETLAPELIFDGFDANGCPRYVYTAVFAARRLLAGSAAT